jgi:hypothetical protein
MLLFHPKRLPSAGGTAECGYAGSVVRCCGYCFSCCLLSVHTPSCRHNTHTSAMCCADSPRAAGTAECACAGSVVRCCRCCFAHCLLASHRPSCDSPRAAGTVKCACAGSEQCTPGCSAKVNHHVVLATGAQHHGWHAVLRDLEGGRPASSK